MSESIKYSVIIPAFNSEKTIGKTIESVLNQTRMDYEVCVVDDGSIDKTEVVVRSFRSGKIKYIKTDNFGGPSRPRNIGIQATSGEWICFLDADDWWTPDKLSVVDKYVCNGSDLFYHRMYVVEEGDRFCENRVLRTRALRSPVMIDLLLGGNPICNSSVVVKRSVLSKVGLISESKKIIATEDYNTWLKIGEITEKLFLIDSFLGYYFIRNNSVSKKDMSLPEAFAVKEFLSKCPTHVRKSVVNRIIYISGRYNYLKGKNKEAYIKLKRVSLFDSVTLGLKAKCMMMILMLKHFRSWFHLPRS